MSKDTLDCRGLSCPQPVLEVKQKLEEEKGPFAVLVDAQVAVENITRFLSQKGVPYEVSQGEKESRIEVKTSGN
jgi:TusA-related sulfurtransferase